MKYLLGIFLVIFSLGAMAQINTHGLTEEQLATLQLQAAQMKTIKQQLDTVEHVSKWVQVGKDLGSGLNATALELGMTANELAKTPLGIFVVILIGWNYMGESLIGILFGGLWLLFTIPVWVWMYRTRFVLESITTYDKGTREDGLRKIKTFQSNNTDDGVHFLYFVALIAIVVVGVLSIFT